jgi:hypothetical protein
MIFLFLLASELFPFLLVVWQLTRDEDQEAPYQI